MWPLLPDGDLTVATTHIDGGRVLIPKEIREAAHLVDGTELEVEITAVGILLRTPTPIDRSQA